MAAKASPKSSKKDPVTATAAEPVGARGAKGSKRKLAVAAPVEPPPKQLTLEERWASLQERLLKTEPEFQRAYQESLDMSWIYHDSALEGSVYTPIELRSAVDRVDRVDTSGVGSVAGGGPGGGALGFAPSSSGVGPGGSGPGAGGTDSSIQPICEEIRRHREALEFIRDFANQARKKRMPITIDVVKKIYLILHPEEGDIKTVKYRKDIPQHRLYFHEYAPPDKITYKVRQILDWTNDPETRRTRSAVRIAARAHYDLLRVFPFTTDSGKVARLFMNLLLLRNGFPPAIVHSTERQRYYEALKGASAVMTQIVHESIENNLASVEKLLEAHESKGYAVKV
jgi:fido (protein-threonine AMPylation protein)